MPATFDTAIPVLVEVTEGIDAFAEVEHACIVRDLRGRVRLVLDGPEDLDLEGLSRDIRTRLGAWFCGPILSKNAGEPSARRLAAVMIDRAKSWPIGWSVSYSDPTGQQHPIGDRWTGYQRLLSKQAWLDAPQAEGAWPLTRGNPAIVAFYSFKGGVGRSTLLGVVAWQLARAGRKVICLDLDIEAPGLGGLLGVDVDASVIDHLLTHAATGHAPSDDPVSWVTVRDAKIGVVPAGRMDRSYIEKLGRLDYLGTTSAKDSPVAKALGVLLERIKGQQTPDYILLDCRAGLHDLGGLSLTDLAHVDVLVGRDGPEGREGLALTLEVLGTRRLAPARRVLIAQSFVPLPFDGDPARVSRERFMGAMYEACSRTIYREENENPAPEDDQAPHYSWPIGQYDEIASCQRLSEISGAVLDNDAFTALRRRIEVLAAPEDAEPDTEENTEVTTAGETDGPS